MLSIFGTIAFAGLAAWFDKGKRFEDHTSRFIIRGLILCVISGFSLPMLIINASVFYLFFDYILNILEDRDWNYVGETSKIDLFWRNFPTVVLNLVLQFEEKFNTKVEELYKLVTEPWIYQLIFKILIVLITIYLYK